MSATKKLLSIALAVVLTAGWGGCGQLVKSPKVIKEEVAVAPDLPDDLLKDCHIEEPLDDSIKELLRVASARKFSLLECNTDKKGLRTIDVNKGGM